MKRIRVLTVEILQQTDEPAHDRVRRGHVDDVRRVRSVDDLVAGVRLTGRVGVTKVVDVERVGSLESDGRRACIRALRKKALRLRRVQVAPWEEDQQSAALR